MTAAAGACFGVAALLAVGDWLSVAAGARRPRWLFKPGVMVALIGAAALLQPSNAGERAVLIAGLGAGLVGDVLLLLPERPYFRLGLVAFLVGHVAYVCAFRFLAFSPAWAGLGLGLTVAAAGRLLLPVLDGLQRTGRKDLRAPALAYLIVISVMTASAFGTGRLLPASGALLFFASDALLALDRFARRPRPGPHLNIVPYQVGQGLLVLSLAVPA